MARKSISMDQDAFERLQSYKREDESWTDFGHRVADVLEAQDGAVDTVSNTPQLPDGVLTEDHIPDLAREVGDEVENRMTRH